MIKSCSTIKIHLIIFYIFCIAAGHVFSQKKIDRDSLFQLLKSKKLNDTAVAKVYNTLARSYVPDFPDSIIHYAKKSLKASGQNTLWRSHAINTIGAGFYFKSAYDSALNYYLTALKLREELGDPKLISSGYNNIAIIYQIKGQTKKAMEYHFLNLKYREKNNDLMGISNASENIANLFLEQKDGKSALAYQLRSTKILMELNDSVAVAQISLNLSNSYFLLNNLDSALYYLLKCTPVLLRHNKLVNLAQAYNGLGRYYTFTKNNDLALEYFKKSKEMYQKIGDQINAAFQSINIGTTKIELKDYKGALNDCNLAMPIVIASQYYVNIQYCYNCLYKANKALNNNKEALIYHEKLSVINDTLLNQEKTKELTRIELTHEFNAKAEIAELKHQKDIEIKEHEKKNQKIVISFILFGLLIAIFMIFFIINRLKLSKKQNTIIEAQKKDVEEQKEVISEKQKEILDSIHYAKRIQSTLLAHQDFVNENLPENFIYFNPKDIVSGDFYWATKKDNKFYLAVCDSTGHGVPGAFMSLLNIGFMSEAINEKNISQPDKVFNYVRERLTNSISKEGQKDGFDGILICFDKINNSIEYAAANNAPVLVSENKLIELPADKMPVGIGERKEDFKLYNIIPKQNDIIFLYTDGYADQFGGPKGKKFKYKQLDDLLISISNLDMKEQRAALSSRFDEWKGTLEQVDDVCVIGIKI